MISLTNQLQLTLPKMKDTVVRNLSTVLNNAHNQHQKRNCYHLLAQK